MDDLSEKMLEVHTEWLNKHLEADGSKYRISRQRYDEYDDPPRLLEDFDILPGTIYQRRIVVLLANPFHEEPTILTGFFDELGQLDTLMQYFDTDDSIIYQNRALSALPEGVDLAS